MGFAVIAPRIREFGVFVLHVIESRAPSVAPGCMNMLANPRFRTEPMNATIDHLVHRSTSPNTMSIALSTAVVSASMWPFIMKSIACRCEKPVGRILQRYGRLVPSATR